MDSQERPIPSIGAFGPRRLRGKMRRSRAIAAVLASSGVVAVLITMPSGKHYVWGPLLPRPTQVTTSEDQLRARATVLVRPECPVSAIPPGTTAVGVVQVIVAAGGGVLDVESLEPESGALAESLRTAALSSRFASWIEEGTAPQILRAKLTFYFRNTGTACETINPFDLGPNERLAVNR